MNLMNITAPLIGGVLAVTLLRYIGKEEYFPWLAEKLEISPTITSLIFFIIGTIIFGGSRFLQNKKSKK